ncbi:hypothetical protein SDC9_130907 [bioreactor metagenome]|uniref:Secretion system C-terminal sorting domain-containing protein n=1 Tax=bioreactor metagenome TaxID=1076179 RepID=A0A645D451_9ZZZZ
MNTKGYTNIQLSSKHSNSTTTPGYTLEIQYKIGESGAWTKFYGPFDVTKTVTLNNPTAIGDGPTPESPATLPEECSDQDKIEIRYLMTVPTQAAGVQVRIDAIILSGIEKETGPVSGLNDRENNSIKVFTTDNKINIRGAEGLNAVIYSTSGSKIKEINSLPSSYEVELSGAGVYIVNINGKAFKVIF